MVPANVDNVRTSSSGSISDVDSVVAIRGPCEASSYAHAPCTLAEKMPKMNISRSCTIQTAVRGLFYFLTSQQKIGSILDLNYYYLVPKKPSSIARFCHSHPRLWLCPSRRSGACRSACGNQHSCTGCRCSLEFPSFQTQ